MLTVIRDSVGHLLAALEWTPVNSQGQPDNAGRWVWCNQLEISQGLNGRWTVQKLIEQVALQMPYALGAYWKRLDSTQDKVHWYTRSQLLREEARRYEVA